MWKPWKKTCTAVSILMVCNTTHTHIYTLTYFLAHSLSPRLSAACRVALRQLDDIHAL